MDALAVATAVLTLALVAITYGYARSTKAMVNEMAASREQGQRPVIAVALDMLGPYNAEVRVSNVGSGPALNAHLTITFEPTPGSSYTGDVRHWEAGIIPAGHSERFFPPFDGGVDTFFPSVAAVAVDGHAQDSLGNDLELQARIDDLAGWWDRLKDAGRLRPSEDAREHRKVIEKGLKEVAKELKGLREIANGTFARRQDEYRQMVEARERSESERPEP